MAVPTQSATFSHHHVQHRKKTYQERRALLHYVFLKTMENISRKPCVGSQKVMRTQGEHHAYMNASQSVIFATLLEIQILRFQTNPTKWETGSIACRRWMSSSGNFDAILCLRITDLCLRIIPRGWMWIRVRFLITHLTFLTEPWAILHFSCDSS